MSSDEQRWAQVVLEAFEAANLTTNEEVAAAGGPSTTTVSKYRGLAAGRLASMPEPRADVYRKIDRAARWEPGSARRLWRDGTPPTPATAGLLRAYLSAPVSQPTTPRIRARLMEVVERKIVELMQEAMDKAASVAEENPEAAESIIDEAMGIAETLRMTAELAADGAGRERLSEPSDRPELALAAHDEEESIAGEQEKLQEPWRTSDSGSLRCSTAPLR